MSDLQVGSFEKRRVLCCSRRLLLLVAAAMTLAAIPSAAFDTDGDGVPDAEDNCLDVANGAAATNQLDGDADGFGNACDGDLNQDGLVGSADMNVVFGCYFKQPGEAGPPDDPECRESDINGDGIVGAPDLNVLFGMLFQAPGPTGLGCAATSSPISPCFHKGGEGDIDGDGLANKDDNCAARFNAVNVGGIWQRDNDHDGVGNACDGDFDNDGDIDAADQLVLDACLGQWVPGNGPLDDPSCFEADMDASGIVDAVDSALFTSMFGADSNALSGLWCSDAEANSPVVCGSVPPANQSPDLDYLPAIESPLYSTGSGPRIRIDETLGSAWTIDNRHYGFARLAEADGYDVSGFDGAYDAQLCLDNLALPTPLSCPFFDALFAVDTLVISNPGRHITVAETDVLRGWVSGLAELALGCPTGCPPRSLLLTVDHSPFSARVGDLAPALGLSWQSGGGPYGGGTTGIRDYLPDDPCLDYDGFFFCRTLVSSHPIAQGEAGFGEGVEGVTVFDGSYFFLADPIFPWQFVLLPRSDAAQGATLEIGTGRIYASGETGMFTAQVSLGYGTMGLNARRRGENHQYVLNVLHWLDGSLD